MEQQRLEQLNRQNDIMRKHFQAQDERDKDKDALATLAVRLVDDLHAQHVEFPKNSQLQNYRTASASYASVVEIRIYLTYQMNRSTNKLDKVFGNRIIENLPTDIDQARLFLGYFCRYSAQYAKKG